MLRDYLEQADLRTDLGNVDLEGHRGSPDHASIEDRGSCVKSGPKHVSDRSPAKTPIARAASSQYLSAALEN